MENFPTPEQPNNPEEKKEHIPSLEEVRSVLEQVLEGQEYEEVRKEEDEEGLDLWEVRVNTLEGFAEFSYKRKGSYDTNNEKRVDVIHVTFFDQDNIPTGGHSVAKYIDGEWKLTT